MSKTQQAFAKGKAFIPFLTAGDPDLDTTEVLIVAMAEAGADLIEIGIPFSDPVAEGPVIHRANERALQAGTTADNIFTMVQRVRQKTQVPLAFMTYMNPVFTYGVERFMQNAHQAGIDAVIVPDVPFEEKSELSMACKSNDIDLISMIVPTATDRAKKIAADAQGFLYCVCTLDVTGVRGKSQSGIDRFMQEVKEFSAVPCVIGFETSDPQQVADMAKLVDGIICSNAIVKIVEKYGKDSVVPVQAYVQNIKKAVISM